MLHQLNCGAIIGTDEETTTSNDVAPADDLDQTVVENSAPAKKAKKAKRQRSADALSGNRKHRIHSEAEKIIRKKAKEGKMLLPKVDGGKVVKTDKGPNKKETLIALMERPCGANITELMAATGWQKHSVHGQLANMRKKDGLPIVAAKVDKVTVYTLGAEK